MRRYETYQDSGLKWIREIPLQWDIYKMRHLVKIISGVSYKVGDICSSGVRILRGGNIQDGKILLCSDDIFLDDSYQNDKNSVYKGDIVMVASTGSKKALGKIGYCYEDIRCTQIGAFLRIIRAKNTLLAPFMNYLFLSGIIKQRIEKLSEGTNINNLRNEYITDFKVPIPPLHEQQAIADYLKDKTSKIEQYVAERERERELLDSLKRSEIANVVTKGLNPDVPMKDSGIPWIGEIPAHWEVQRVKNMFCKEKREVRENDEVITCFRDGQVTLRNNRRTSGFTESFTEYGYQGVRKGDLVIHQMDAFAGAIGVSDSDGKGTSVYHCCTPKGDYNVYYYAFLLRRMAQSGYIQSLYRGIRERSSDFKFTVFGVQYLPIPPLSEQQAIVDYIDTRLAKIDQQIAGMTAEIEYLKEFKQRLISDAVTGAIKVTD